MYLNILLISIFIFLSTTRNAHAYLDPGIFTIIINLIIGFFAGAAAFVSMFWKKIKKFFLTFKNKKKNEKQNK